MQHILWLCRYLYQCLGLVEAAARHESQYSLLLESGVVDALEYTCLHDFPFLGGVSISAVAAGGVVALLGRNEDGAGKTLSRDSAFVVVDSVAMCFDKDAFQYDRPLAYVASNFTRVATMCISDANKRHMLEHGGLVQMLLSCLMIDGADPRRGQEGAEALQESCAGVFQELALFGPGASLLRSHGGTLDALRTVAREGSPKSRERASAALFELEQEKRGERLQKHGGGGRNAGGGVGTDKSLPPPPHVMASYNWDHQEVILRVVTSLQDRGYLVWVDTEQMKGATVDTMALAVEGSAVVLLGVSRAYKESSNCRMEAQYALQKKKPLIPLMLTPGYEADGWLGLLLGTSIWYGFYGDALSSGSGFDARMDSLCREIGSRGRADASHHADVPEPAPVADSSETASSAALRAELQPLKLTALRKRALAEGIAKEAIEVAMDATDDAKEALRGLIVETQRSRGPRERILTCLRGGGEPAAEMVRGVLEHASEVLDEHTASSPRKARKALVFLLERMEAASELVDAAWCDGLCRHEEGGKLDLLDELCAALALWEGMAPGGPSSPELSTRAAELLDCLGELGLLPAEAPAAAAEGGA
eukprot:COSAG06_NODE_3334_length_5492_cov_11.969776_2_plen_594_part_00